MLFVNSDNSLKFYLIIILSLLFFLKSTFSYAKIGDEYKCTSKEIISSMGEKNMKHIEKLEISFKWLENLIKLNSTYNIPIIKQSENSFDAFDGVRMINLRNDRNYNNFLIWTETTFDKVGFIFTTYKCEKTT